MVMPAMPAGRGNVTGPNVSHNQTGFITGHLPVSVVPPHIGNATGMDTTANQPGRDQMAIIDNPTGVRPSMALQQQPARRIIWSGILYKILMFSFTYYVLLMLHEYLMI